MPADMAAQVIRAERFGAPRKAFRLERLPLPRPRADEVLLRVMAAGVNHNGVFAALGQPLDVIAGHRRAGWDVDFHVAGDGLNPLRWIGPADENAVLRPMAHFLCLDRWGQPSEAELGNGMPFHGEASRVRWREFDAPERTDSRFFAAIGATLPMAGLEVRRTVRLSETTAVFSVSETVINRNKLGRIYNMVQHATIGPPFLDETTVVDSNAQRGFMQSNPMPNPEQPETRWPEASKQGQPVDLRHLTSDPDPNVVSFVIDGEFGWVTATSASKELLLGYMWRTADYPWLNFWRHVADGKPLARGLEFGTTGLHQPFNSTRPSLRRIVRTVPAYGGSYPWQFLSTSLWRTRNP